MKKNFLKFVVQLINLKLINYFAQTISLAMKKTGNLKSSSVKKNIDKKKESGELKKATKLKPLKEKEKKNWKNNLNDDDDDDFDFEDDLKLDDTDFDDDDDDDYYDDRY